MLGEGKKKKRSRCQGSRQQQRTARRRRRRRVCRRHERIQQQPQLRTSRPSQGQEVTKEGKRAERAIGRRWRAGNGQRGKRKAQKENKKKNNTLKKKKKSEARWLDTHNGVARKVPVGAAEESNEVTLLLNLATMENGRSSGKRERGANYLSELRHLLRRVGTW